MSNYFPIEGEYASLSTLLKRWKFNNIFTELSSEDLAFLIWEHCNKKYIKPFIIEDDNRIDVEVSIIWSNDKPIIWPNDKKDFAIKIATTNKDIIDVNSSDFYFSKDDINKLETGNFDASDFENLPVVEKREIKAKEFLHNGGVIPDGSKRLEAYDILSGFDSDTFKSDCEDGTKGKIITALKPILEEFNVQTRNRGNIPLK